MNYIENEAIIPLRKQIGTIIQEERYRLGLSVSELAAMSESSRPQVIALEDGSKSYTIDLLLRVTASLGLSMIMLNESLEGYPAIGLEPNAT